MARARTRGAAVAFDAITIEGALISPAMLTRIARHECDDQSLADYRIPKGLTLRDEIARYFRIGQALFTELTASRSPSLPATIGFIESLLRDVFGFTDVRCSSSRTLDDRQFVVTLEGLNGRVPVVVVPPSDELDRPSPTLAVDGHRRSAASAIQDWLNATNDAAWGLCSNGLMLRLVRANASLTRPAFIEADLEQIFEDEDFADFTALWLLTHASRFGKPGLPVTDCSLERWRDAGQKEGVAARANLRKGVEAALLSLGTGFLSHVANAGLREKLRAGTLPLPDFFGQLLRLVYRLIFLLAAEDRNLLHVPVASAAVRKLYAEGYSVGTLRDHAVRRTAWDRHHDRWDGLLITFAALARGEPRLGLPALDGLFAQGTITDLDSAKLTNRDLMEAIYRLAWLKRDSGLLPVNWRDMETEELGSVYESLLELTPQIAADGRRFTFAEGDEAQDHARKTSGSYYTPDSLVQVLLDSALDPVLDRVEAEADDPAAALLSVTVLDPACGSGHFLLAAARRIATRLARVRTGGVASAADFRHALRDVARACIYGVDRNPMAVELTKVALWIETVDPGKPLGYLDANVRCGDALVGLFNLDSLVQGIPDAAYKPLLGDDKETAKHFTKRNKAEREGQGTFDLSTGVGKLPEPAPMAGETKALRALPEDTPDEIAIKRKQFEVARFDPRRWNVRIAADLYIAAFVAPKTGGVPSNHNAVDIPTTAHVWAALAGRPVYGPLVGRAQELAGTARAFHWPLEFPDIIMAGGFDLVIGNPPWDKLGPDEREFFSPYDGSVRFLAPKDQDARIAELRTIPGVEAAWQSYCHQIYAVASFIKNSGRYKLFASGNLGKGEFNLYRMFVELALSSVTSSGRAAQFVPDNICIGANATAIRKRLFKEMRVHTLVIFENTGKVWFDIDSRSKFCFYVASRSAPNASIPCVFGINTKEKLLAIGSGPSVELPISLIEEFSPATLAISEIANPIDISISKKVYARFPKFGAVQPNLAIRTYAREIDMTKDNKLFVEDNSAIPLYEGRMVEAFDHRAKAYKSGRARAAVWAELKFGSPEKAIRPQWYILRENVPADLEGWWNKARLGFCKVIGATNQRALIAAIIPPHTICGNSVSTILFSPEDNRISLIWLAVANSFCMDFVVRKKVSMNMTYTVVDSLPLPRSYSGSKLEREIARRSLRLSALGPEMTEFWNDTAPLLDLELMSDPPVADSEQRSVLRAELDVLVARELFGITLDEMRYILDPADILGPDCGFETFGALKRAEERHWNGYFRTRDLIVNAWRRLERLTIEGAYVPLADLQTLPHGAWARPTEGDVGAQTLAQIAALLEALPGPTPIDRVRLAGLYALEPRYLTQRLSGADRNTWLRLVGSDATPSIAANVVAFTPKIDAGWRNAITQLRGMGALVENAAAQTWEAGERIGEFAIDHAAWPFGRATFVVNAMNSMALDEAISQLPAEDQAWVKAHAA